MNILDQDKIYVNFLLLHALAFTYICDWKSKQTFSIVVGLGHSLALLKLFACTPYLVDHLMGMVNVCVASKPSN